MRKPYILWFREIANSDVAVVGGKNASLGEMYQQLTKSDIRIPNGFAITIDGYRDSLMEADLSELHRILDSLDKSSPTFVHELSLVGLQAREIIYKAKLQPECVEQIKVAYRQLCLESSSSSVAVRSSATAEDLPTASFAGQHDSFLNITNETELIDTVKRCYASLFTDRAISYRMDTGFDHFKVFLSVGVMKMVRSDVGCSGVMFTIDTETGFQNSIYITGSWGLGENIVQGTVDPDEFYVFKPTFKQGFKSVLRRRLGKKQLKMIFSDGHTKSSIKNILSTVEEQGRYCLNDNQVLELASFAIKIEDHYTTLAANKHTPMDIEWAMDGVDGLLYVVQARPETVSGKTSHLTTLLQYKIDNPKAAHKKIITTGHAVGTQINTGVVHIVRTQLDLEAFRDGEILVSDSTCPDWEPILKRASGIITNRGGRTCHASIVARELGIPAVVGAEDATQKLKTGDVITLSCADGETGLVFRGYHPFTVESIDLSNIVKPSTKVMINFGNPEKAFASSFIPCDGVGLCRMEFVINEYLKVHPMALVHPDKVKSHEDKVLIEQLICNDPSGKDFMVRTISEGIGTIAAAFYPRPVVVRLSDFKSNEYASLIGGKQFEPEEENPMLGFRGACRYTHPSYREAFELECRAMKRIVYELGLKNVIVMIPFCRNLEEAGKVIAAMATHGLTRRSETNRTGLEIYMMCEIPSNVIQIDDFSQLFDGFSIGSNDLTQLTLGCDRDSALVADIFDERNPSVVKMIKMAIEGAKRNHKHIGICGQAPSDFPEVVDMLVEANIDSISVTADSFMKTLVSVNKAEKCFMEQTLLL